VRLDEIAEDLGGEVEIQWKSYLLRPEPEDRTIEKFTEYTQSWKRPGSMEPRITFNPWSGNSPPPSHSIPAALAGKVAGLFGAEAYQSFHHRAMEAYFTDNRTISDVAVLVDIAAEAGIDRAEFDERWQARSKDLINDVIDDHNAAVNAGISGVPAVVVGDKYLVGGAVDTDEYRQIIAKVRSETR